jgi:hypothetical protein
MCYSGKDGIISGLKMMMCHEEGDNHFDNCEDYDGCVQMIMIRSLKQGQL